MVRAWATDTHAGHDTLMLAWRRRSVAQLNRLARHEARRRGWLTGEDLTAPGGREYAIGDRVITLAPNHDAQLVTSQRAQVIDIDHRTTGLTLRTDDGRTVTLAGEAIDAQHLDHGYALTVHREQGATSDRAHVLAEGGGRQLAYVALSRARHHTTIHTIADSAEQAIEKITDDWTTDRDQPWLTPTTEIGEDPRTQPPGSMAANNPITRTPCDCPHPPTSRPAPAAHPRPRATRNRHVSRQPSAIGGSCEQPRGCRICPSRVSAAPVCGRAAMMWP